jgi:hypothetical protein
VQTMVQGIRGSPGSKMDKAPQLLGSARLREIAGAGLEPATPAL